MNAPVLSRRHLLGATAAVGAMSLPAVAEAGITVSGPDAALFDLIRRHAEADAVLHAAEDEVQRLLGVARAAYPPRPDALQFQGRDIGHDLGGASAHERLPNGRYRAWYTDGDAERLRTAPPLMRWAAVGDDVEPPPREPDPEGEARRREIVTAHDAWAAACREVDRRTGYAAADDAQAMANRAYYALDDAIRAHEVSTLLGLRAKAAWMAKRSANGLDEMDALIAFARQVAAFGGAAA